MKNLELQKRANDVRKGIVTAVHGAKAGHPGGSLSAADIFTFLYFEEMNIDPKNPDMEERDRFVLSKGHTAPGLYSALAYRGYFPVEDLPTLRHLGSYLQGHPCIHIPGVDMSSGSLGQGISAAVGMALGAKMDKRDFRVYTLLGDGEIEEGQVWEAAMFAGFRKLDNLCVMVDNNNLQIDGPIDQVCSPYPIDKKFEAFNFHVINADAHDFDAIRAAFKEARETKGMPTCIVFHSIKGKGVSFMENSVDWHGKAPNDEEYAIAMEELEALRYASYLKENGILLMCNCRIEPTASDGGIYPQSIRTQLEQKYYVYYMEEIPLRDKTLNVRMVGAAAGCLGFSREDGIKALEQNVAAEFLEKDKKAFLEGWEFYEQTQKSPAEWRVVCTTN